MLTDSGKSMLILSALILIPFISLIVGRLRSLAIDFVGSAISLTFSFFDAAVHVMDELTSNPKLHSHAGAVVYVLVYVFMVMLVGATACIWLQNVYAKDLLRLTGKSRLQVCVVELIYWTAVILSIVLVLFAFSLNVGCRDLFVQNDTSTLSLFALFRNVLDQHQKMGVVLWSTAGVLVFCAVLKYILPLTSRTEQPA